MKESTSYSAAVVAIPGLPKLLSYALEPNQEAVPLGTEVLVEVGRRETKGWIVDKLSASQIEEKVSTPQVSRDGIQLGFFENPSTAKGKLKPLRICGVDFLPDQLPLFYWMAEYYGASLVDVIDNAIPKRHQGRKVLFARAISSPGNSVTTEQKTKRSAGKQTSALQALASGPLPLSQLETELSISRATINSLKKKGLVEVYESFAEYDFPEHLVGAFASSKPEQLTGSQQLALNEIFPALSKKQFAPFLLMGVTGSGKTEIYLRAVEKALAEGGSALVIVPEIALTPQLIDHFRFRLGTPIALLHSQLGEAERWASWEALLNGKMRVALGPRSAVFAPISNLSLIVVDEEHESSYKQNDGLHYHGRDVAVMRAKFSGCPIILGSATPSFESLLNVKEKRYRLLELPERVATRPMPTIEIVNLREIKKSEMVTPCISPSLHQALTETLAKNQQAIILHNRRGFSTYFQCDTCEEVLLCPNCSVSLVYHRRNHQLVCHYCGVAQKPPEFCPHCRNPHTTAVDVDEEGNFIARKKDIEKVGSLRQVGSGTERLVDDLKELFPDARIMRMDRDTMTTKDSYREVLSTMRTGEADILVGTQMIAKGHDLPGVTLVGVIDADIGLNLPDFRASEKSFQLLTQVAGRAGRGNEGGRVIIQTREPHHPTLVATATGRFRAFARYELDYRKSLGYPPWGRLLRIVISSPHLSEAFHGAELVANLVRELVTRKSDIPNDENTGIRNMVLGPAPAPHEKLRTRHRWHLLVKSGSRKTISELAAEVTAWRNSLKGFKDLRVTVDVDPVDML